MKFFLPAQQEATRVVLQVQGIPYKRDREPRPWNPLGVPLVVPPITPKQQREHRSSDGPKDLLV